METNFREKESARPTEYKTGGDYKDQLKLDQLKEIERLEDRLEEIELEVAVYDSLRATYEKYYKENPNEVKMATQRSEIRGIIKAQEKLWEQHADVSRKIEGVKKNFQAIYGKAAEDWFAQAKQVGDNTSEKKKKLYLGNIDYVAAHAENTKDDKKRHERRARILSAGVWSWGVNLAWVTGGISGKARFKIKYGKDQYNAFPQEVLDAISMDPKMKGDTFLLLCKRFPGTLLWSNKDGGDRPTWFALEVTTCLDSGYCFQYEARRNHADEMKLSLVRC